MDEPQTHIVTAENGPRPAGKPDECFYCRQPIGAEHATDCVCRTRTVVIRYIIEAVQRVPASWDAGTIAFHRNESSWCATNLLDELCDLDCICPFTKAEFIREATAADVEDWETAKAKPEPCSPPGA